MIVHELKTWPEYFGAILTGEKRFEVRRNDRDFKALDWLKLREWSPKIESYTGREITVEVSYLLQGGSFGIEEGFCVMAIRNPTGL